MKAALLVWVGLLSTDVVVVPTPDNESVPTAYLEAHGPFDEKQVADIQIEIIETLLERGLNRIQSVNVLALDDEGRWTPLPTLVPPSPAPKRRSWELKSNSNRSPVVRGVDLPGQTPGALSNKIIYVSQGHGWYWSDYLKRWATQRGNTHGIVEDFVGAETINHYFIPLLLNAGATVFPMREFDMQANMVLVDDDQATLEGSWSNGPAGFNAQTKTYSGSDNPFEGGTTIQTKSSTEPTASATFAFDVPDPGRYAVYIAWTAGADRVPDARVLVEHAAGKTPFQVDQRRHGSTWVYLGHFHFGTSGSVRITNQTDSKNELVSIDAVRIGGGKGLIERGNGSPPAAAPTSLKPRWEECSRYTAQYQGAPPSVFNNSSKDDSKDDVGARARYARWQNEDGEDSIFVSWHSNAPEGGTGTSTWVYGPNPPNGEYIFQGVQGSDALAASVHHSIITSIRNEWDPNWKDRGIRSAWFGELNPNSNPEMPATLVETAFHATQYDAELLAEPRFRYTLSRAYYRGIVDYFAERDGIDALYMPEAPVHFRITGNDDGTLTFAWEPSPDGTQPLYYRLWTDQDENGEPTVIEGTTFTTTDSELPPVTAYVTAVNEGGESFPSTTLSAWAGCNGKDRRALIVQGFTRLDRSSLPVDSLSPWGLGEVIRLRQSEVNSFDYATNHSMAFSANNVAHDAAEASAVEAGLVSLDGYGMVDWLLGEESTIDETFTVLEQQAVEGYLDAGGRLFVSGSEVSWDLDNKGTEDDRLFSANYLKVLMSADSAQTKMLSNGISFDHEYDVNYPDVLIPQDGAEVLWRYDNNDIAAIHWSGDFSVVTSGFPLETAGPNAETLLKDVIDTLGFDSLYSKCKENNEVVEQSPTIAEPTPRSPNTSKPDTQSQSLQPQQQTKKFMTYGLTQEVTPGCQYSRQPTNGQSIATLLMFLALLTLRFRRVAAGRLPSDS